MDLFQDQTLIRVAVGVLAVLAAWWLARRAFRLAVRISRLGCLALLGMVIVMALAGGFR